MYVLLHSKDELIRTLHRYLHQVKDFARIRNTSNHLTFDVLQFTKMKYRPDGSIQCDPYLQDDDSTWLYHVVKKVGCIPKYWESLVQKVAAKDMNFNAMYPYIFMWS